MKFKTKKIIGAALSLTMAATIAASQIITYAKEPANSFTSSVDVEELAFDELTGSIDLSNIVRDNLSDKVVDYGEQEEIRNITGQNAIKTVIVSLETASIAEAKGDDMSVAEYLQTSAGERALKNIKDSQDKLLADIAAAGIKYTEVTRYSTVINAVAIEVNTSQFNKIRKLAGVSMAGVSKTYAAPTAVEAQENYSKIYGTGIYDSTEIMEKYGYDGSGITVAILDTGLDYTHEAFSYAPDVEAFDKSYVAGKVANLVAAQRTPGLTVDDVYLSAKVPFAYDYSDNDADVYPSYSQHGVHVAGIVAGKAKTYVDKDGNVVSDNGVDYKNEGVEYSFLGVAPEAQIVVCKVFTDNLESDDLGGATSEDIIAALDDCVTLGVDIINMSLGTTSGFSNLSIDGDEEGEQLRVCYENIKKEGISLIAAAGNEFSSGFGSEFGTNLASNPDSGTVGSPSTFVGALSVASVNGQKAPYMLANGTSAIYYEESNDANAVPFDFAEEMLGGKDRGVFPYFVVPNAGENGDYSSVRTRIAAYKEAHPGEKVLVVVRRGKTNFKDKVSTARSNGADGVIVYNNVPGTIRMSLSDINIEEEWIPSASVNIDAGTALTVDPNTPGRLRAEGTIEINKAYEAGPFMNDYSSWGATPDLNLKPEITSHGGEITSAVSGGYQEMSGTSMATPNLAGLMALVRGYLKNEFPEYKNNGAKLTQLANQIVMSSATLLFDEEHLPYSPRKQGAGLATLRNIFTTQAYLATDEENGGAEDNRPKYELGDDKARKGEYEISFSVTNFGNEALNFKLVSRFFTETLASDGLAVAEAAHMFGDIAPEFTYDGVAKNAGDTITVAADNTAHQITVKLKLSAAEKKYLNDSFKNGMYVEGFISLESDADVENGGQCSLNIPFMGFYGDWGSAPMLDYNAYEIAAIEQDSSILESEKPHESVFATQLFSTYYNGRYGVPMGGYAYVQNEQAEQIYVTEEHCSISRFNIYNGATATDNYLTSTGIRALYAGLLRNAEVVTYDIYDVNTGEKIYSGEKFRIGKAYANGGSATPALVDLKLDPDTLGLINNGKYSIEFNFYMKAADKGTEVAYNNNFTSTFYVDYDAPIMQGSRIRYYNYKEGNDIKQRVYLDIDVYDNHYPQSVLLCYSNEEYQPGDNSVPVEINLATEYVTPVYNPAKNSVNTVEIEITEIYHKYRNRLYVQLDDYALNHSVYRIYFGESNTNNAEKDVSFVLNDRVTATQAPNSSNVTYNLTIEKNEMYRVELNCGDANALNYSWNTPNTNRIRLRGNEIFGLTPGEARVTVTGGSKALTLHVTVVDSNRTLPNPNLTFGVIADENRALVKAFGTVKVNAGQTFKLEVESDPWYYPVSDLTFTWTTSNAELATVEDGMVTTKNTKGSVLITATAKLPSGSSRSAQVTLSIQDPFRIDNMILNKYYGSEEVVKIPDDKNVMYIGEEAFEDNDTMKAVIIPKTVTEISERAFLNCTALERVYFIKETKEGDVPVADLAKLNLILADAFQGCTNLKLVDLTNVKVITLGRSVFADCTNLEEVRYMEKIGIAGDYAFKGCTALKEIDITGLHTAGDNVFEGCTQLDTVETGHYTAFGAGMFYGCTALKEITINNPRVNGSQRFSFWTTVEDDDGNKTTVEVGAGGGAFENCTNLTTVKFNNVSDGKTWDNTTFKIYPYAFANCTSLTNVNFNGLPVSSIGDYAFKNTALTQLTVHGTPTLGNNIFDGVKGTVSITFDSDKGYKQESNGAIYCGTTLVLAPKTIDSSFAIKADTTEIAPYAFSASSFDVATITIPSSVEIIGEGAFYGANITSITIPANISYIAAKAFASSALESITIPSTVKEIGESAFENCRSLEVVIFDEGVETIGSYAFSGTSIQKANLPASVKTMGSYVFYNCRNLEEATLPAIENLGDYTFTMSTNLQKVTFGADAKTSGNYTFFPGTRFGIFGGTWGEVYNDSALTTVDLGGLTVLGDGVFWACNNLETINLKNVTKVGVGAFAECTKLSTVTNLDKVIKIDDLGFASIALKNINLASATEIGEQAFYNVKATEIKIPVAESVGRQAFMGSSIYSIEIPKTLVTLGAGAFTRSENLNTVTVEEGNEIFFVKDNVLYRIIENVKTGEKNTYELCLYPANLPAGESEEQNAHYRVIDGTIAIQAFAFAYINQGMLASVTMPYSLKTIGAYAFFSNAFNDRGEGYARISRFNFESIVAPTLLSEYYDLEQLNPDNINLTVFRSMYYTNFNDELIYYVNEVGYTKVSSTVIYYPSNGTGYTNYVYSLYFGTALSLGELIEDDIRTIKSLVDSFDIDTVNSWMSLEVNDTNKAMVEAFAEKVKEAHRLYNSYTTKTVQLGYLNEGEDRVAKLTSIEVALKPVKARFGISANISSARVADTSKHRTTYAAGESFDMTGLEIEVSYDDYSTEIITDTSLMTLETTGALYSFDNYVEVRYSGSMFRIAITVSEDGGETPPETETPPEKDGSGCGGCGSMDIGSTLGGTGLVLLTLAGAMLLMSKVRRKANK